MKASITALCAGSVLFFSCANEKETVSDRSVTTTDSIKQATATAQMPVSGTSTSSTFETTTPQNTASTSSAPNPAHGEPGHRCDIAVGAPLNSPPSATPTAPATTSPAATFNPPPIAPINTAPAAPLNTTPTATAPGMNPPHGEPGHDCGIAVGAPLNK